MSKKATFIVRSPEVNFSGDYTLDPPFNEVQFLQQISTKTRSPTVPSCGEWGYCGKEAEQPCGHWGY